MVLDENAIELSVSVGGELSVIELSVMKEDWERAILKKSKLWGRTFER